MGRRSGPGFQKVFYLEVLSDLKKRNKAVVVISHDDRYFDCADKLVWLEDGKLKDIEDLNERQTA